MKWMKAFERAMTGVAFAEAGLFDEARRIVTEKTDGEDGRKLKVEETPTSRKGSLQTLHARG